MSSKSDEWTEVYNRLTLNPTLAGYVKKVYDFDRDAIISSDMPCITMHPMPTDEEYADFPKRKQDFLRIQIKGIIFIKDRLEFGPSIMLGNSGQLGLFKFEADIKNALEMNTAGTADDLSYNLSGHYPKLKITDYRNMGNVSAEVVMELQIDGRYFFVGNR